MSEIGDHAVVLGASMGGLLAARVLADAYRRVTIVERDPLPESGLDRKGVPQGRHAHVLLPRGAQILDELFPGLLPGLAAGGVPVVHHPREIRIFLRGHLLCQHGEPGEPASGRAGHTWNTRSASGSGPCPTSQYGTGGMWLAWSPHRPATGSPGPGCGRAPAASERNRSWPPISWSTRPAVPGGPRRGSKNSATTRRPRSRSGWTSNTPAGTCGRAPEHWGRKS